MQFTCSKKAMTDALAIAMRAVKTRSPLPVLQCVRFTANAATDNVELYATDYETAIWTKLVGTVETSGEVAIPAKQFSEIVNAMPGDTLKINHTDAGNIIVQAQKSTMRLTGVAADDMVRMPAVDDEVGLILPEGMLRGIIAKVVFAASKEETRPRYCGSNLVIRDNYVEMVATDTHICAVYRQYFDAELGRDLSVILPREGQLELLKLLKANSDADVLLMVDNQQILFQIEGRFSYICRLIEGPYCDYRKIIPRSSDIQVVVDRALLLGAMERLAIVAREDSYRIRSQFAGEVAQLKAQAWDNSAEEEVPIGLEGGAINLSLHAGQISAILSVFESDEVSLHMTTPLSPILLRPTDSDDYFALAMPLVGT